MEIDPEWFATLFSGMGIGGGAMKWAMDCRSARRATIPNVRAEWGGGSLGHSVSVTIQNRMDEDLLVYQTEAKARMIEQQHGAYDPATGTAPVSYKPTSRREGLAWRVEAGATAKKQFFIEGADAPKWLRLTMSSSAKTVRKMRIIVSG